MPWDTGEIHNETVAYTVCIYTQGMCPKHVAKVTDGSSGQGLEKDAECGVGHTSHSGS